MRQDLAHTFKRYRSLYSHRISVLPVVILMPHSACNCRCVMCDIWKGNKNAKQLTEEDIRSVLSSLKVLDTKRVVMSGGEALLNKNFFTFCDILKKEGIAITLLSTGMTVERHAEKIISYTDEVIVSLDGHEELHDQIRNIPGAFNELKKGVQKLKALKPDFQVSARCVIHQLNYAGWPDIILAAKKTGLDRISFLPADVSSNAFNRPEPWEKEKQQSVLVKEAELPALFNVIVEISRTFKNDINSGFISEPAAKLAKIHQYYAAHYGKADFPDKECNAPWVSVVIEADGAVRPCFFHDVIGSIKDSALTEILNKEATVNYRKNLDIHKNSTCQKCVCYLNLSPRNKHY